MAERVKVNRSNVSIFLSKQRTEILTILQDRPNESSWLAKWWIDKKGEDDFEDEALNKLWDKIIGDLTVTPRRRVREHQSDYLLYVMLNYIGEELRPIAQAY